MKYESGAAGYIHDGHMTAEINRAGKNNWEVYIQEIIDQMGLHGLPLSLNDLEGHEWMTNIRTLIIGSQSGSRITPRIRKNLEAWVGHGGLLIGFAAKGLDDIFGIETFSATQQQPDDYTIAGYFDLRPQPSRANHSTTEHFGSQADRLTRDIHPILYQEQKLIILSDLHFVAAKESAVLGHLYDASGQDLIHPSVTWNGYGGGYAAYFSFDVAKTVWLLHQGKPAGSDAPETNRFPDTGDLQVIGHNSNKVPYADELIFLVQNMVAEHGHPLIYQLPTHQDKVPDALLFWGGDEYHGPVEWSLKASDWMKEKGLPYHINIESDRHPMTVDQLRHIQENGHEVSAYYRLNDEDSDYCMTEDLFRKQSDLFYDRFGYRPVCTVNHCLRWKSWVEPARWMAHCGGKADNSFKGARPATSDFPLGNAPWFGFGHGTSYPFHFYDDYANSNVRIDFVEEPIVCYEIGHRGSMGDTHTKALGDVYPPLDMAIKYHLTINMFYHPFNIVERPHCREAIEEILAYIEKIGADVVHMGNDQLAHWWHARSQSRVVRTSLGEDVVRCVVECQYDAGMIVRMLLKGSSVSTVLCDGEDAVYTIKDEFAGNWLYVVVPQGEHTVEVKVGSGD